MLYRIENHGETPSEAAAFVEEYLWERHGIQVRVTPLVGGYE